MMLRPHAATALPTLTKEAAAIFPSALNALTTWQAPWSVGQITSAMRQQAVPHLDQVAAQSLLHTFPSTTNAMAASLGLASEWYVAAETAATAVTSPGNANIAQLLNTYPDTLATLDTN